MQQHANPKSRPILDPAVIDAILDGDVSTMRAAIVAQEEQRLVAPLRAVLAERAVPMTSEALAYAIGRPVPTEPSARTPVRSGSCGHGRSALSSTRCARAPRCSTRSRATATTTTSSGRCARSLKEQHHE